MKDRHPHLSTVKREHYTLSVNSINQRFEKPEQHFNKVDVNPYERRDKF